MELILVRHAETTSNVSRRMDTAHPGADLTDLGRRQAQDLADYLAGERVEAMYVSPRRRTRSTAAPLAARLGVEPVLRDGLVEISAGEWEMSADETHRSGYADTAHAWISGELDRRLPGGEGATDVLARFDAVVEEVLAAGHERVVLVAHGAILRVWCGVRVAGLDLEQLREQPLRNTAVIRLSRDGGGWGLREWDARPVPGGDPATEPVGADPDPR